MSSTDLKIIQIKGIFLHLRCLVFFKDLKQLIFTLMVMLMEIHVGLVVFNIPSSGAQFSERGVNISQIPQHMWPRERVLGKALEIIGGRVLGPPSHLGRCEGEICHLRFSFLVSFYRRCPPNMLLYRIGKSSELFGRFSFFTLYSMNQSQTETVCNTTFCLAAHQKLAK